MCLKPFVKRCIFVVIQIFGRYANIENNDGDDDPCQNALTVPEPLLASAHSFSNISTILVPKNT